MTVRKIQQTLKAAFATKLKTIMAKILNLFTARFKLRFSRSIWWKMRKRILLIVLLVVTC